MATLDPNKAWADGMKQQEFEIAFMQRNPTADSIPDVDVWLGRPALKYHGIDGVNLEDLIVDDVEAHKKDVEPEKKANVCPGCKQGFEWPIALYQHKKRCEILLAEASL